MIHLSIVVPCFNRWSYTKHCIENLLLTDKKYNIEIIISDDGSKDETQSNIDHYLADNRIKYVRIDHNTGFGKTCNRAFLIASGDIVLFLNNDVKIKGANWIDILLKETIINPSALMGPLGGYIDHKNNFIFCYETGDINRKINYVSGFCLFAYKKVFDNLILPNCNGPFDEEYFLYYEDSDLSFRHSKLGNELKIIPLPIQHIGKVSTSQHNTYKMYNEGRQIFLKKWKGTK